MDERADAPVTGASSTVPPPPPESPGRQAPGGVPWTLGDVLAVAVLVLFVVAPLAGTAVRAAVPGRMATAVSFPVLMVAFALTTVGWVAARHPGHLRALLGPGPATVRDALSGMAHGVVAFFGLNLLLGLLFVFLTELVGVEVAPVQQRIREFAAEPAMVPFLLFSVVVAAPIAEELYFRGMLFRWLRARVPIGVAVFGSALVFGFAHWESGNPAGAVYMVVSLSSVGAYLAWVFHRRGTLVAPVTMHATFNLLAAAWILQGIG